MPDTAVLVPLPWGKQWGPGLSIMWPDHWPFLRGPWWGVSWGHNSLCSA